MKTAVPAGHVLVWEFLVRAGAEADFEAAYGPAGAWAQLFGRADGYLGTELLRDPARRGRYLTIDRWASSADHARFLARHGAEYAALDARCEAWTEEEVALGAWTARPG
jgi:heme-degrading monooxygenase HmoA